MSISAHSPGIKKWKEVLFPILGGVGVAFFVSFVLYAASKVWVALFIVAFSVLAVSFIVKDFQRYFFALFITTLPLNIKKVLVEDRSFHLWIVDTYGYPPGTHALPQVWLSDLVLGMLLLVWVTRMLMHRQNLEIPKAFWFGTAFLGVSIVSISNAIVAQVSYFELIARAKYLILFLYIYNHLKTMDDIRFVCRWLSIGLAFQGLLTGYNYSTQTVQDIFGKFFGKVHAGTILDDMTDKHDMLWVESEVGSGKIRASGTVNYANPNAQGQYYGIALPLCMFLALTGRTPKLKVLWWGVYLVGLAGLVMTFSRGALFAYLVGSAVIVLLGTYRKLIHIKLLFALGVLAIASIPFIYFYMTTRPDAFYDRFPLYLMAFTLIQRHPLLGVGVNNSFIAGYTVPDPDRVFFGEHFHNFFLTTTIEIGIFGTILFIITYLICLLSAFRAFRPDDETRHINWMSVLLCGGFVGLAAHLFADHLSGEINSQLAWMMMAMGLALYRISKAQGEPPARSPVPFSASPRGNISV